MLGCGRPKERTATDHDHHVAGQYRDDADRLCLAGRTVIEWGHRELLATCSVYDIVAQLSEEN